MSAPGKVTRRDLRNAERQIKGTQHSIAAARLGLRGADDAKLFRLARELEGIRCALVFIRRRVGKTAAQLGLSRAA